MNLIQVKLKSAEILSSGTVISFQREPIEIVIGPPEASLSVIFEFVDTDENMPNLEAQPQGKTLILICKNFKNPIGSGTTRPLSIGTLQGKKLYLNFRIYDISSIELSDKTLQYTFYLVEEGAK